MKNRGKFVGNEINYVTEVLESGMRPISGTSWTNKLENAFTRRFGIKYAIAHNSGTSALHSCLSAIGVGPGDEVITPALTVTMNSLSVLYQNAVPVYADIDPDTLTIDPTDIEKRISPRTKAIMTVSLYGLLPEIETIIQIAAEHNLYVIEDNAQCYLGAYKGKLAGTWGHLGMFSMENSKHISTGEGGMVVTNDKLLAERVRKCGGIGYSNLTAELSRTQLNQETFQDPDYKRHDYLGWNYRLPEINAAVGLAQMERLDEIVEMRRAIAKCYDDAIDGCNWLIPQKVPPDYTHAYWTYAVKYEGARELGVSWKTFYRIYRESGGDGFYAAWSIPYLEPVMSNRSFYAEGCPLSCPLYGSNSSKYEAGLCPRAESIQPKIMQFKTNYLDMQLAEQKAISLRSTIEKLESSDY